MSLQKPKLYFYISTMFVVVAAVMLVLIQFVEVDGTKFQMVFPMVIAAVFWLSVICSQVFMCLVNISRKKAKYNDDSKIGLISFFKNKEAMVADIALMVFAVEVVLLFIFKVNSGFIVTVSVALLFLSFFMHCYLNGKNYRYIKTKT